MPEKSHLKFLNEKQISEIKDFKYNYGPISNEDEDSVPKNYFRMAASFKEDLEKFDTDIKSKYRAILKYSRILFEYSYGLDVAT